MKKILFLQVFMVMFFVFGISCTAGEMKGMWVTTVFNLDYPTKATTDSDELKREAEEIINNCEDMGINNIFLQVRPMSDAFYKSSIYPWSNYLTGSQGTAPDGDFDPLVYWIDECHKRGIKLHAWINPYKATRSNKADDSLYKNLANMNPAKQHPEYLIKYENDYYYDPALPEVRELVINGAMEIVNNYEIDGIHFDDYFYPGMDFDDSASFAKYGSDYDNKADWRRNNVNMLISTLSERIKETKPNVEFGISPCGIWANSSTTSLGSNTRGMESYTQLYADTRKWALENTIDYIAPQIYWNIGYDDTDYKIGCEAAKSVKSVESVCQEKTLPNGKIVKPYILLSAHREENIDTENNFLSLFNAINAMAEKYDMPILYSCHPRSRKRLEASGFKLDSRVIQHEPLGFHDYNCLQMNAFAVVSDSGTLPEESSFFTSVGHPFPAVCIRTSTERPEALDKGCFFIAGIDTDSLLQAVDTAVTMNANGDHGIPVPDYVDENVSTKVVKIIQSYTGIVNKMVWRK